MDPASSPQQVSQLLANWRDGDRAALQALTPLVYEELHRLAQHYMKGARPDHTLQATALVNEAYLRLADQSTPNFQNRSHFFAVSARAMRQILVDYARGQQAQKRGSGARKVELDEGALVAKEATKEIIEVSEALQALEALDERKARVVEMKYFGGLTYEEIAEVLKISVVTVRRDWDFAKAWLHSELTATSA